MTNICILQPMMMMVPMMMPNQMFQNGQMIHGVQQHQIVSRNQNQESTSQGQNSEESNSIRSGIQNTPDSQMTSYQNMMQQNFMGMFHPMPVPTMMNGSVSVNQMQPSTFAQSNQMMESGRQNHHSTENRRYQGSDDNSSYGGNLAHCA